MLVLEFISDSSTELFEELPTQRHSTFLSMFEKTLTYSSDKHQFIKINIIRLVKNQFIIAGFLEFDHEGLIDDFNYFFRQNHKKCIECLRIGYIDDFNDIVDDFFMKKH